MERANTYDVQLLSFMGMSKAGDSAAGPGTSEVRFRGATKLFFALIKREQYVISKISVFRDVFEL